MANKSKYVRTHAKYDEKKSFTAFEKMFCYFFFEKQNDK